MLFKISFMGLTSITLKDEEMELLVRAKSKMEMKTRKTVTWGEFLVYLANYYYEKLSDNDLDAFI